MEINSQKLGTACWISWCDQIENGQQDWRVHSPTQNIENKHHTSNRSPFCKGIKMQKGASVLIRWQIMHVMKEYTDVIENLQYSVDKPDEAKWYQMTSLWDTRFHLEILRNCVTDSYFMDSPTNKIPVTCILQARYPQTSHSATIDDAHEAFEKFVAFFQNLSQTKQLVCCRIA
jgi:hypothetical protein